MNSLISYLENKLPRAMRPADLPIFEIEQPLLETLTTKKRLVLTAPTGSGKSTQVPQMLLTAVCCGTAR